MEQSIEARWLINNWNEEVLSKYRRQWIAVFGERIVANGETFRSVAEQSSDYREFRDGEIVGPLFAFVHIGRLQ